MLRRSAFPILFLLTAGTAGLAQQPTAGSVPAHPVAASGLVPKSVSELQQVMYDSPGDGAWWVRGNTWKGCFDAQGFCYVPYFGAEAPRNYPVRFKVLAATVGGRTLPLRRDASPTRVGDRFVFDRGALHEIYDLALDHCEQSFVVQTTEPGDLTIELGIESELVEDAERPGLQFGNERGYVAYGEAFLIQSGRKVPIATTFASNRILLRVPASLRGDAPVVIDPIINTQSVAYASGISLHTRPDVAYDSTNNAYLVVWQSAFSVTDNDIASEMFDGDGNRIAGSGRSVDSSSISYTSPRVAGRNDIDRFLVVMERSDPSRFQGRTMVYARVRDASPGGSFQNEVLISDPNAGGNHVSPDVGGDAGTGPSQVGWPVVWTTTGSSSGYHLFLAFCGASGATVGTPTSIHNDPRQLAAVQISRGNGNGRVAHPGWFLTYTIEIGAGNHDIWGVRLGANGVLAQGNRRLVTSPGNDIRPQVSSPAADPTQLQTWYMLTYMLEGTTTTAATSHALIFDVGTDQVVSTADLTQGLGLGAIWCSPESDGTRFAVTSSADLFGNTIGVDTLSFDGNNLRSLDHRVMANTASFPSLVANNNGGGGPIDYAIVSINTAANPARTTLTRYWGHLVGTQIAQWQTSCHGLQLQWSGLPFLGTSMSFTVSNFGQAAPGVAFGLPASAPTALCPNCSTILRQDIPIQTVFGPDLVFSIPNDVRLLNVDFAFQGFAFGQGTCFGGIAFSDALVISLR